MQVEFNGYNFVKLERERIKDLVYILEAVYGEAVSEEELAQRHLYCHGSAKFIGYIAYDKNTNEPAAYYGVFPVFVVYEGKNRLVAQSGDTMTHPAHQKKGLFIQLAKVTFEYCRTINIELIFGFPNKNSYPGFMKHLGFTELPPLDNVTLLENKFELNRISSMNEILSSIHRGYLKFVVSLFSKKGEAFANSNSAKGGMTAYVLHDDLYFKLKDRPHTMLINVLGVNVFISIAQNQVTIGDMDVKDSEMIDKIIARLRLITRLSACRFLSIGGSANSYLVSALRGKNYVTTQSYKLIFLDISAQIPYENFTFLNCDVDVF